MAVANSRGSATRPPTGLLLSIGDITTSKSGREIPTRIDYFRPKEGALDQYTAAAQTFHDVYGDKPKQLDDLFFLSNNIGDVLDVRLMAWGSSGVRLRGDTNYATLPRDEWEDRAFAYDDGVTFYPIDATEVPRAIRDTWAGAPILDRLNGPDDPRIKKYEINVECTLSFCLPKVMGFGTVAQITTKSRRSMRNLLSSVHDQHAFFQGTLVGVPFRLSVRPARSRRFDQEKRGYVPFSFYELVLDTPFTVQEAIDAIRERRAALGGAPLGLDRAESRAIAATLELPAGEAETQQVRDEPSVDGPDDALLNRLARLEQEVGPDAARAVLVGVFGVEGALELDAREAERYEAMLQRNVEASETVADADVEIEWPGEPPA